MVTINSSVVTQSQSTTTTSTASTAKSTEIDSTNIVSSASADDPQISDQAKALSSLYDTASSYIKQEHLEAYTGNVNGQLPASAYIDVGKYNDYVFDKAASAMVDSAKEQGITLDKKDVLAQLKSDNSDIAKITTTSQQRTSMLGSGSVLSTLSSSDLDALTNVYIDAKENNLDMDQVEVLAVQKGIQNQYGSTLGEGDIYPYDWDYSETDPDKIAAAKNQMSESISSKADEIKTKLQGDLGLGSDFMAFLLNPKLGLRGATDSSLDFLSQLIDIQNEK